MTPRQAKQIILYEGGYTGEDGINVLIRMGDDPGPERMHRLIVAIKCLFDRIQNQDKLERPVAAALFQLGSSVPQHIVSWADNGRTWRPALLEEELPALVMAVESMFENEWLGDEPEEHRASGPADLSPG